MIGSNIVRDRVAVAFITLSVAATVVGGGAVAVSYNQRGASSGTAGATTDNGTATDQPATTDTATPGAAGTGTAGNSGTGGSSTTTSGGGSGSTSTRGLSTSQADSGVTGDKITVGGIFDETGAVDSTVERDTVRAYFAKINAQGGVNGRKLELIDCDSRYDSTAATQCANQMISNKVLSIVGWTAPKGENEQVQRLAHAGIPIIGGLGTPEEFNSPLSFPVSVPFTRYGQGIAERASELGIKHPAIVVINDVPWVATVLQSLLDALHAKGIKETHVDKASATQGSYDQDVLQLRHQNDGNGCASSDPTKDCPDGLIAALDPFSYSKLFASMDGSNWHTQIIGGGMDKGTSQHDYADQVENANSLVPFISPYDNTNNPTVADYLSTVNKYYPGKQYKALDVYTQHSWTAAMIFVEAVKRAGKNINRATLVDALNSIKNFDTGWSKPISYAPGNHDPNHCFMWTKHDGKTYDAGGSWHTISDWKCF
ncbi:MAG: branched-chain amino acid transport system substrate-binding protein [Chloroflexota bacterium]|nr:branched-chain amino acid transport system substrate-binding protein [Chloroflexota bacterium]